jgi:hypothetical protein
MLPIEELEITTEKKLVFIEVMPGQKERNS